MIQANPSFQALRDNTTTTDPDIEFRRNYFDSVTFPLLEQAGFERSSLVLAWDFTVGTQDSLTSKMMFIRDDGLSRVEAAGGVQWGIRKVEDDFNQYIARHIEAQVRTVSGRVRGY